jgi:hypothetical protein
VPPGGRVVIDAGERRARGAGECDEQRACGIKYQGPGPDFCHAETPWQMMANNLQKSYHARCPPRQQKIEAL